MTGDLHHVMSGDAGIVTPQGFPHGVRCLHCDDIIPCGAAYTTVPCDGYDEIVCAACSIQVGR